MDFYTLAENPFILQNILLHLDWDSIINYYRTYKGAQLICRDMLFWEQKALHDFNTPINIFRDTKLSADQRYLQLLTENGGVGRRSEKFITVIELVRRAIRQNREDLVQYAIEQGFTYWGILLQEYAAKGNVGKVNEYLKPLSDDFLYQKAAEGALSGGHTKLLSHIVSCSSTKVFDLDKLAKAAAVSGDQQVFDFVRSESAKDHEWDWSEILSGAITSQNIDFINYILSLTPLTSFSPRIYKINWTEPVIAAFRTNDDIINLITPLIFPHSIDVVYLTDVAISERNQKLLDYIKYIIGSDHIEWSKLLSGAIKYEDLAKWVISQAHPDYQWNLDTYIEEVLNKGHTEIFNRYLKLFPNYPWKLEFSV